jgi:hypothetical protein
MQRCTLAELRIECWNDESCSAGEGDVRTAGMGFIYLVHFYNILSVGFSSSNESNGVYLILKQASDVTMVPHVDAKLTRTT